jgi:hypothetical protein
MTQLVVTKFSEFFIYCQNIAVSNITGRQYNPLGPNPGRKD